MIEKLAKYDLKDRTKNQKQMTNPLFKKPPLSMIEGSLATEN